ncbi:hypothetical protein AB9K36_32220 [Klebsiella michiganensis]
MNRVTFSVVAIMLLASAAALPFRCSMPDLVRRRRARSSAWWSSRRTIHDGQFHDQLPTPGFTGQKNMLAAWWGFLVAQT